MGIALDRMTITIGCPDSLNGNEGRREVAAFYCELLGMRIIREDWLKIATTPESPLHIALDADGWSDLRPPRWPDPEFPQQMHLDIRVSDLEAAGKAVVDSGATLLQNKGARRTYADPVGHPFCLVPGPNDGEPGEIARVVFDCFTPRSLAVFYEGFLGVGVGERTEDAPERVVLSLNDDRYPDFTFQHAVFVPARWPDPAFPAQLHVDYHGFGGDPEGAQARAEQFGAIRLPTLSDTAVYADPAGHPFCI